MSVATSTAIGIAAGVGAVGAIGSAAIGSSAASNAASTQAQAANNAANLQHQDAQQALDFNKQVFNTQQNNLAPWLTTGRSANANLASLMGVLPANATIPGTGTPGTPSQTLPGQWQADDGSTLDHNQLRYSTQGDGPVGTFTPGETIPGTPGTPDTSMQSLVNPSLGAPGSLAQGWQGGAFQAPTDVTEQNDPGYQFRLAQGQRAIEQSAAARGGLLSGGTAKALNDYSQGQASNEYSNVYNRALGEYQQNYNQFQQNATDKYNRLANLAGMGQITAQQLNQSAGQAAGNNTNILLTSGQQIGQNLNNAGAATASGYIGGANAWSGGLNSLAGTAGQYAMLNSLYGGTPSYGGTPPPVAASDPFFNFASADTFAGGA